MTHRASLELFADDFDVVVAPPPEMPAEPEPPPPPTYSQAELDVACAQARAEGRAAGIADAAAADAARIAATLATIAERLGDAGAQAARVTDESATVIARLILSSVLAGYPLLATRHGLEEVRALVRRTLPGLLDEPRVTFHVHPSMVPAITDELAAVPLDARTHMTIEPSDAMPPGDALITWPHGGASRKAGAVATAIADILRPLGLLPEPDPACADADAR